MEQQSPRISVLMITYNQEKFIGRALESLLCQREYLFEICINDDCSTDNTWGILQEYASKYPNLIKPVRNEHNLGIFQNIEATWERPTGDLIYHLAGDDEAGSNYFKAVLKCIEKNHIDWKNELFCVYGDYIQRFPDGRELLYKQKSALRHVPPIRLKLRGLVSNRSACYSIMILNKFKKVSEGRSYSVESVQDCQLAMFTEKNYYVPVVGNIYYAAIGVSVNTRKELEGRGKEMREKLLGFMKTEGIEINPKDLAFMNFRRELKIWSKTKSPKSFFTMMKYYKKSLDYRFGWDTVYFNTLWNVLRRRKYYH